MNLSQPASCLFPIKGALGLDSSCHKPLPFDRTRAPSLPHPSPSSQTNTSIAHITMHFLPTAMVALASLMTGALALPGAVVADSANLPSRDLIPLQSSPPQHPMDPVPRHNLCRVQRTSPLPLQSPPPQTNG